MRRPVLSASHIKPWAVCTSSAQRLDVFNGLLLAPHLGAVFDDGCVTVRDDGAIRHLPYLGHHRQFVFRS